MVCAGAGFNLVFADTVLLTIVFPLVNAGEYFVRYCHNFRNAGTHVSSMFWAKSFWIACIDSRGTVVGRLSKWNIVSCGIFKFAAVILKVSWSERGRDS